ncbi:MAG: hypothetical protein JO199_09135 [Candidatus Eremiobacteraeota bacterium]|nr:hypothetical protein [Candidatus Eremiobacteraeota bacterium]
MSTIAPAFSLLNNYDPTNPASSLDSALTNAGLADTYYQQGIAGTPRPAPGAQAPTTVPLATGAPSAYNRSTSPNLFQQSLASLTSWSAQQLITSAIGGSSAAATSAQDLTTSLENWAQLQQSQQAAQRQASLAAAQRALNAAELPTVNATA